MSRCPSRLGSSPAAEKYAAGEAEQRQGADAALAAVPMLLQETIVMWFIDDFHGSEGEYA
jgi:hypothetical protein